MSNLITCDTAFTVEPVTNHIICSGAVSSIPDPSNSKLTYEDFTLLGGAILTMFILAWSLKNIRLIINR